MGKRAEFNAALKEALKSRDMVATSTIRLMLAALKERDIAARGQGGSEGIGEPEILSLLQSMIKQRRESSETYRKAERPDLADREDQEIEVINRFLPRQMEEGEILKAIEGVIAELNVTNVRDMGKVMAAMKARYAGQADMTKASALVKERLVG